MEVFDTSQRNKFPHLRTTTLASARIDLILFRNSAPANPDVDVSSTELVSDDPLPITPTVNWISDHFGVAAWMELLP